MNNLTNDFSTIIDTLQVKIFVDDISLYCIEDFTGDFVKSVYFNMEDDKGSITLVLNLNRVLGHYNRLESLQEHEDTFKEVLALYDIEIDEDINLNRLDIAIDSTLDFKDNIKYHLYIFELLTYSNKRANRWHTTDIDTLQATSIKSMARSMDIVFYDKASESKGRHYYNTRMEFRYKRLTRLNFRRKLLELIDMINTIDINIPLIDKNMGKRLCKLYDYRQAQGTIQSLSEFVRCYDHYIYTRPILDTLYTHTGLKGNVSNWLKDYRARQPIILYTKADILRYKQDATRSIRLYND